MPSGGRDSLLLLSIPGDPWEGMRISGSRSPRIAGDPYCNVCPAPAANYPDVDPTVDPTVDVEADVEADGPVRVANPSSARRRRVTGPVIGQGSASGSDVSPRCS
jgi:hypothetical protein